MHGWALLWGLSVCQRCSRAPVVDVGILQLHSVDMVADPEDGGVSVDRRWRLWRRRGEYTFVANLLPFHANHRRRRIPPARSVGIGNGLEQFVRKSIIRRIHQLSVRRVWRI